MLELSPVEQQVLDSVAVDAQKALLEYQRAQQLLEEKRTAMIAAGGGLTKVLKAVLILKGVNPDAYEADWSESSGRTIVTLKGTSKENGVPKLASEIKNRGKKVALG